MGACFSGLDAQDDSVLILRLKDEDLLEAPDDSAFLHSLPALLFEGERSVSATGPGGGLYYRR